MLPFQKSITKEEVNELPLQGFDGEIVLVDQDMELDNAVQYLKKFPILGFDTETRPSFKKGRVNDVALLQLAANSKTFLFRINKIGLPEQLLDLLADPKIMKVGAAIKDDIRGLQKLNDFDANGFLELQEYVSKFGIESYSLKKLSAIVLNFRISKRQQVSNWEAEELSSGQLKYAATDAWVSLKIFEKLKASIA
ncbi:3'-5' exonuclease domain-containing protein 2 [Labilibaculum sp. A4]|uniref:3'-5' exonuclease n=1 Tax=Labilibaculum euxinus TaxID=2686357 RepID=A0A425YDQ6_9BACT|nr:3'-5' exonuclease [Labilibaculum euxinus]MDQ1770859.1 3'-5' exonuclease [Labilibaculum euxinus]MUP37510.1 3'-5' exonuclease domain-containing protein 2 [Labilibaculum euxinus]MVB06715.1 3'-5' exonuclease domain-containing protein 2 [Labilibaculum euxinus]MWN76029.1 3'-5' exonuclease domain-containing protein 2 [Labilibaculum euxinus]